MLDGLVTRAPARDREVEAAKAQDVNLINTFYRDRLVVMPTIADFPAE